jgi:predicted dehydrogenase
MNPLKTIVVGAGHLGRIHARLASESRFIDLVGVVDAAPDVAATVAFETGARSATDYRTLVDECEAAIVATPTVHHHDVCADLIAAGKHVLVEKPITHTVTEADALVRLSESSNCVLQVGHVERFNPALEASVTHVCDPKYIRGTRASGYTFRSTDIGVVMDLMIHDIDVVLSLARSTVKHVRAFGVSVLGKHEDLAHAELVFESGCVAHLVASRVSFDASRSMQIYSARGMAQIDFATREAQVVHPREDVLRRQFDLDKLTANDTVNYRNNLFDTLLAKQKLETKATNAIAEEQRDFAESIRQGRRPRVDGHAGRDALAVAESVLASIESHAWDGTEEGRHGPLAMPALPIIGGAEHWTSTTPLRRAG